MPFMEQIKHGKQYKISMIRVDVIPVADPNIISMAQRVTLANENLKIAMSNPMTAQS
jgi:hypothetical protein